MHHLKGTCGGRMETCLWCEFGEGLDALEFIGYMMCQSTIY